MFNKMKIKINGKMETLKEANITVGDLLKIKEVKMPQMVSVELNGKILKKDEYDKKVIKENDEVNFLYFMGGGSTDGI